VSVALVPMPFSSIRSGIWVNLRWLQPRTMSPAELNGAPPKKR
jgi:hypothetical protein